MYQFTKLFFRGHRHQHQKKSTPKLSEASIFFTFFLRFSNYYSVLFCRLIAHAIHVFIIEENRKSKFHAINRWHDNHSKFPAVVSLEKNLRNKYSSEWEQFCVCVCVCMCMYKMFIINWIACLCRENYCVVYEGEEMRFKEKRKKKSFIMIAINSFILRKMCTLRTCGEWNEKWIQLYALEFPQGILTSHTYHGEYEWIGEKWMRNESMKYVGIVLKLRVKQYELMASLHIVVSESDGNMKMVFVVLFTFLNC